MSLTLGTKLDGGSLVVGAALALGFMMLLGASKPSSSKVEALQQRFLVLESSPVRHARNGYRSYQLKICPHYGKIDQDSLKFRVANETQELKMIVVVTEEQSFNRGDIISFSSLHRLRLAPGSQVTRHLPGGGRELVP